VTEVAKTAIVDSSAELGKDVVVGPGCVIGPGVVIGDGCILQANVILEPGVVMGRNNRFHAHCVMGDLPQILGCMEANTQLIIGDDNVFRENVTIHRGSPQGGRKTVIGNQNYFMVGCHLGHDCEVEDHIVVSNYTQVSGHVKIERKAWLSGLVGIHQFVTVGCYAYIAGMSVATHDVPPFVRIAGSYPCEVRGLNVIGLRRAGLSGESIQALIASYRSLYMNRNGKPLAVIVEELRGQSDLDENVVYLLDSLARSTQHRFNRYRESLRSH
jgi:UDP-N-acetylglucosamine acyltransferase